MADDGPLQLSPSSISRTSPRSPHADFPGERLIACRNPVLAADRARTREDLLAATEKLLAPLIARVQAGKLTGAGPDRRRGRQGDQQVQDRQALRRHHHRYHAWPSQRRQDRIDAEAALDGFYVLRTPVPAAELDAAAVVTAYKNLKYVERDFRHIKSDDLDLRPVFHRLEERVRAHVLICMLACYLTWHLRRAWAPLTFTDQEPAPAGQPGRPGPPLGGRPGQGLLPARPGRAALPQLPRPAGAPGHLDPQPGPVHRNPGHHRDARRADQRPAAGLRAHRRSDPADLEVARTPPGRSSKTPGQTRNRLPNWP